MKDSTFPQKKFILILQKMVVKVVFNGRGGGQYFWSRYYNSPDLDEIWFSVR